MDSKEAMNLVNLGERIKKVRKAYNLTQQVFADKLRLKQNTVATYEIEKTTPSKRTILDICRVFHVNETWLLTGEGDMLLPPPSHNTPDEELLGFLGDVSREASFRSRLIYALSRLSDEDWAVLERLARDLTAPEE